MPYNQGGPEIGTISAREGTLTQHAPSGPWTGDSARPDPPARRPRRVRPAKLGTTVVEQLVDDIVRGALRPGSALPPEGDLCEEFGVSRTVIRESVKVIQEKGLVRIEHGRGTQVTDPRRWNLLDDVVLTSVIAHDENATFLDELVSVRTALNSL
jgi:GntR family galactonate operon transcriptional repressor